jgi:hypothetical protein
VDDLERADPDPARLVERSPVHDVVPEEPQPADRRWDQDLGLLVAPNLLEGAGPRATTRRWAATIPGG